MATQQTSQIETVQGIFDGWTVDFSNIALEVIKTGLSYAIPTIAPMLIPKNAAQALLNSEVKRTITLPDGAVMSITIDVGKFPQQLRDSVHASLSGTLQRNAENTNTLYTPAAEVVVIQNPSAGGGGINIGGLIGISW